METKTPRKTYSKDEWGSFCRDIDRQRKSQVLSEEEFCKFFEGIKWIKIKCSEKCVLFGRTKSQVRCITISSNEILLRSIYYFSKQKFPLKLKDGNSVPIFFVH